jgi:hypothetical protein
LSNLLLYIRRPIISNIRFVPHIPMGFEGSVPC